MTSKIKLAFPHYIQEQIEKAGKPLKQKSKEIKIPAQYWQAMGCGTPIPEYCFDEKRRWRIDYAWPGIRLALEVEGGVWSNGRHTRGSGFLGDLEKYNSLTEHGWYLLRYQPNKIDYLQVKKVIDRLKNSLHQCTI